MITLQNQNNFSRHATLLRKPSSVIAPHDLYGRFDSLLAETEYMLSSGAMLADEALSMCFLHHPILVIRAKAAKEQFLCVSNIRTFMLAHAVLKGGDELPVILLDSPRPSAEEIALMVNADLVVTPLL